MLIQSVVPVFPAKLEAVQVMTIDGDVDGTDMTTLAVVAVTAVPEATLSVSAPSSAAVGDACVNAVPAIKAEITMLIAAVVLINRFTARSSTRYADAPT
jgi:hypothetical protein